MDENPELSALVSSLEVAGVEPADHLCDEQWHTWKLDYAKRRNAAFQLLICEIRSQQA